MYAATRIYAPAMGMGSKKVHQNHAVDQLPRSAAGFEPTGVFNEWAVSDPRSTGSAPPCIQRYIMGKRTSLNLTDERERLIEQATEIVAADETDDPPMSVVIDAALTHLVQSRQNIDDARGELDPTTIQQFNTDVLGLRYRTSVDSRWR